MSAYFARAQQKAALLCTRGHATVLAVESSCDETAAALVRDGREVLGSAVHTQIALHRQFGGVVPEVASRSHAERLPEVVRAALDDAGADFAAVDAVAVTHGPGLIGALLCGLSYAKGLALALDVPLVCCHHIASHIAANYVGTALVPPFVCLVVSGGHTLLAEVTEDAATQLGGTRDDAAGEALDKVARLLGLPYPGGVALEALARAGDETAFVFRSGFNKADTLDMSFSGLKTGAVNLLHTAAQRGETPNAADVAASFQRAVVDILCEKAMLAVRRAGVGTLALAGGVAANTLLRGTLAARCAAAGVAFACPPKALCTDNAAMVGAAGFFRLMRGEISPLDRNGRASLPLG